MADYELPKEKPLTLKTAVETIGMIGTESFAFYNTITGELYFDLTYDSIYGKGEIDTESEGWVAFPDSFDKEELHQMRKFARRQPDPAGTELLDAAYQRHPYRSFKDTAARLGYLNAWFAYYDEWLHQVARDWAERHNIELAESDA